MKKGLKLTLQITAILLVVAAIGVGIYWLVVHNNSAQVLANSGFEGGGRHGGGFEGMPKGNLPEGSLPEFGLDRHDGRDGMNLTSGLWTAGRILLEIGVVTLSVLLIQWLIRKVRRPKAAAAVVAPVTNNGISEASISQPEAVETASSVSGPVSGDAPPAVEKDVVEPGDLFPPDPTEDKKSE